MPLCSYVTDWLQIVGVKWERREICKILSYFNNTTLSYISFSSLLSVLLHLQIELLEFDNKILTRSIDFITLIDNCISHTKSILKINRSRTIICYFANLLWILNAQKFVRKLLINCFFQMYPNNPAQFPCSLSTIASGYQKRGGGRAYVGWGF